MLQKGLFLKAGDTERTSIVNRLYQTLERHLFSSFFALREATWTPSVVFLLLQWLVVTLQLCHFISDRYVAYEWNSRVADVFNTITNFVSHFPGIAGDIASFHVACSIVYGCLVVYVSSSIAYFYLGWMWPLIVTHHALQFASTTFFIPTVSVFAELFFGCLQSPVGTTHPFFADVFLCWSEDMIGVSVVALLLLFTLIVISLITQATLFPTELPQDFNGRNSFLARHLNRAECAGVVCKVMLLILFASARSDSWRLPLALILMFSGVVLTSLHIQMLEPFSDVLAALYIMQWMLVGWSGFIAVLMSFLFDPEGVGMLFFIGIPLIALSSFFVVQHRYREGASFESRQFISGGCYVLFCRSLMRNFLMQHWRIGAWVDMCDSLKERREQIIEAMDVSLTQGVARFPDCIRLRSFRAYYFLYIRCKPVLALQEMTLLDHTTAAFDVKFFNYALQVQADTTKRRHLSEEIERYLEFKRTRELADGILFTASRSLVQFWSELLKSNPSVDVLTDLGHDARSYLADAMEYYARLLHISGHSVGLLHTLGLVHLHLTGEVQKAADFLELAEKLERSRKNEVMMQNEKAFTAKPASSLDIFDEHHVVASISISEHNFAQIQSVTGPVASVFGFNHVNDVIGKNVSILMPSCIGDVHDQILREFLNGKNHNVVNHVRTVFGQQQITGYLIPLNAYIRWSGEFTLVGVIQPLSLNPSQAYVSLDPGTGMVRSATMEFYHLFGFTRRDVLAKTVSLAHVMPALANEDGERDEYAYQKMAGKSGFMTNGVHVVTGRAMNVHAWSATLDLPSYPLTFVRLDVTQLVQEDDPADDFEDKLARTSQFPTTLTVNDDSGDSSALFSSHASHANETHVSFDTSLLSPHKATTATFLANMKITQPMSVGAHAAPYGSPSASSRDSVGSADNDGRDTLSQLPTSITALYAPSSPTDAITAPDFSPFSHSSPAHTHALRTGGTGTSQATQASATGNFLDMLRLPDHSFPPSTPTLDRGGSGDNTARRLPHGSDMRDSDVESHRGPGDGEDAGERDAVFDNTVVARRNRAMCVHRRLQRAIRNDNAVTERKLRLMNVFSVILVASLIVAATILYIVTAVDMKEMKNIYDLVYKSSVRSAYLTATLPSLVTYLFVATVPTGIAYQFNPHVHKHNDSASILAFERNYYNTVMDHLAEVSSQVDRTAVVSFNNEINALRHENTLNMEQLYGNKPGLNSMSLKEAFTSCSAAGHRVTWLVESIGAIDAQKDTSFWWMIANGNQRLREASRLLSSLLLLAFSDYRVRVVLQPLYFLLASLAAMFLVTWFMVKPIVTRVEDSKTEVLHIFLGIPHSIRRALRRKALIVFEGLKKNTDASIGAQVQHDDEDDGAQAKQDQAALDNLSSEDSDVLDRYARSRGSLAGIGSVMGRGRAQPPAVTPLLDKSLVEREDPMHLHPDTTMPTVASTGSINSGDNTAAAPMLGATPGPNASAQPITAGTVDLQALTARLTRSSPPASASRAAGEVSDRDMGTKADKRISLLSRRALRTFYTKYSAFILLVIAYFVALIFLSDSHLTYQDKIANLFIASARRLPMIKMAWHITRLHIFTNYTQLTIEDPDSPYIRSGNYVTYGKTLLKNAEVYNREAVFGTSSLPYLALPELQHILFENPCDIERSRFNALDIEIDDYYFEHCLQVGNGVLRKGLYAMWLDTMDMFSPYLKPEFSNYLSFFVNPSTLPAHVSMSTVTTILQQLNYAGEYINHYITPLIRTMSAVIHEHGMKTMNTFATIRTGLFVAYLAILLFLYFILLYPTSQALSLDASKAKSLMLLLPPDLVRNMGADSGLQQYINENLSLE